MKVFPKAVCKHLKLHNLFIVAFVLKPGFEICGLCSCILKDCIFKLLDYSTYGLLFSS